MPQTVSGGSAPGGSRPTDSATLHPGLHRRADARFPRYSPYLYTRSPSPVRTAVFPPLCTPEGLLLYKLLSFPPLCTPQALLLYELLSFPHSVHQKPFSCTNFCLFPHFVHHRPFSCTNCRLSLTLYTRRPSPVRTAGRLLLSRTVSLRSTPPLTRFPLLWCRGWHRFSESTAYRPPLSLTAVVPNRFGIHGSSRWNYNLLIHNVLKISYG